MPSLLASGIVCTVFTPYIYAGVQALLAIAFFAVSFAASLFWYGCTSTLNDESLEHDLKSLKSAFGTVFAEELIKKTSYDVQDVERYYRHTTDRDYKLLEAFVGPGLHSRLEARYPIGHTGGNTRQPALLLAEISSARGILGGGAKRVLEIGCGRGHCSLWLAGAAPDIHFVGIDLTPRHIEVAKESALRSGLTNVEFFVADATQMENATETHLTSLAKGFDVIFGVEAMCHIDTTEGQQKFMKSANRRLNPYGKLIFFDGFRSSTFEDCSKNQRTAMLLAECGFRIRAMPSKQTWVDLGHSYGFKMTKYRDFTEEALPFWELGWRVARVALLFPTLIRYVLHSSPKRKETAANLLSVSTTAHAMRNRSSAEYGMLVLDRP